MRIILNMVPFNFISWILRSKSNETTDDYDHLQTMEIIGGRQICQFHIADPITIQ